MKKLVLAFALFLPLMLTTPQAAEKCARAVDAAQCSQTQCTKVQCPPKPRADCQKSCPKKAGGKVV